MTSFEEKIFESGLFYNPSKHSLVSSKNVLGSVKRGVCKSTVIAVPSVPLTPDTRIPAPDLKVLQKVLNHNKSILFKIVQKSSYNIWDLVIKIIQYVLIL